MIICLHLLVCYITDGIQNLYSYRCLFVRNICVSSILYRLLMRDTKHTLNGHINMLFSSLRNEKMYSYKLCQTKICSIIFLMIETEMSLNVCLIYHTTQGNSAVWSYLVLSKTSDILSIRTKSPFTRWFYFCILFFFTSSESFPAPVFVPVSVSLFHVSKLVPYDTGEQGTDRSAV